MNTVPPTRQGAQDELDRFRADFHLSMAVAPPAGLLRPTAGTRWADGQLLFHMFFGYLVLPRLLSLVRLMSRPRPDQPDHRPGPGSQRRTVPHHQLSSATAARLVRLTDPV